MTATAFTGAPKSLDGLSTSAVRRLYIRPFRTQLRLLRSWRDVDVPYLSFRLPLLTVSLTASIKELWCKGRDEKAIKGVSLRLVKLPLPVALTYLR